MMSSVASLAQSMLVGLRGGLFGGLRTWKRMGSKRVAPKDLSVETLQLLIHRCCRRVGTTKLYEWLAMAALQVTWKTAPQAQAKPNTISNWFYICLVV